MKYDLHIHTKYSSCSNLDPALIIKLAQKRGMDGIAITDHHTTKGAEIVAKYNKDKNFEVILGCEIATTDGGEILAYYIQDNIHRGTIAEVLDSCRSQGCIVSLAHPFDSFRKSFAQDQFPLKKVDALECWNGRALLSRFNKIAVETAEKYGYAKTAGSDAHFDFEIGQSYTEFEYDLRKAIRTKATSVYGTNKYALSGYGRTIITKLGKLYTNNTR